MSFGCKIQVIQVNLSIDHERISLKKLDSSCQTFYYNSSCAEHQKEPEVLCPGTCLTVKFFPGSQSMAQPTHLKISGPSKLKGSSWSGRHFMSYCKVRARDRIRGHAQPVSWGLCWWRIHSWQSENGEWSPWDPFHWNTEKLMERQACLILVHNRDLVEPGSITDHSWVVKANNIGLSISAMNDFWRDTYFLKLEVLATPESDLHIL